MLYFEAVKTRKWAKISATAVMAWGATLALTPGATPARATIVTTIFTGTVDFIRDTDGLGLFGNPSVGNSFTLQFVYDLSQAIYSAYTPTANYAYGGTTYGGPPFIVSAEVTINGITTTISGNNYYTYNWGDMYGLNDGVSSRQLRDENYIHTGLNGCCLDGALQAWGDVSNFNGAIPATITDGFSYNTGSDDQIDAGVRSGPISAGMKLLMK